jgi:hypothetical protein
MKPEDPGDVRDMRATPYRRPDAQLLNHPAGRHARRAAARLVGEVAPPSVSAIVSTVHDLCPPPVTGGGIPYG